MRPRLSSSTSIFLVSRSTGSIASKSRGECVLHLSEHHGVACPGSALRIETDELEAFQQQLMAKDYKFSHPQIQAMPWGSQDMTIADPFGNRLVFTNAISL